MTRRAPENRQLFGRPPDPPKDRTPVRLPMHYVDQTEKAWLLRPGPREPAKWAPKSEVRRGEGPEENLFTMPRWVARERGWL